MSNQVDTKRKAALGVGGALLVLCCIAGPAVLGAVGGSLTGNVLVGAGVAVVVALVATMMLRWFQGTSGDC